MTFCRLVWLIACLHLVPSIARADAYCCTESGKAVFSDKPCVSDMAKVPMSRAALPPVSPAPVNLHNEGGVGRIAVCSVQSRKECHKRLCDGLI
jgi:hypothetical protein